jgi:hypothetical protein
MTQTPETPATNPAQQPAADFDIEATLLQLRRKQGNWVQWGSACQNLQKSGYTPQQIFEATGFEPIHQNQIIVGSQVYNGMLGVGIAESVQTHFSHKGSDILYELRILTNAERAASAALVLEKGLDLDEAKDVAKAVKDFSRLAKMPEAFTNHPGDMVAHQAWTQAKQQGDLQKRSQLIAKGLRFAHSRGARQQVEQLLTDFTVTPQVPAPRLPVYRLDSDDQMPRVLPVVGALPLAESDFRAVPLVDELGPFGMVKHTGPSAWVPVPGWQVVLVAEDPVVLLTQSDQLPAPLEGHTEEVLVVVDRAKRQWSRDAYFVTSQQGQIAFEWFESEPEGGILGQVVLIMRPRKILDEDYTKELWQLDE